MLTPPPHASDPPPLTRSPVNPILVALPRVLERSNTRTRNFVFDDVSDAIARATGIPPAVANAHAQFDGDHDGQITIDETFGALKFIGVPIASAAAAQVLAALEGSTSLGVSEFNDVVKQLRAVDPAAPAAPAFTPTKTAAAAKPATPPPAPSLWPTPSPDLSLRKRAGWCSLCCVRYWRFRAWSL